MDLLQEYAELIIDKGINLQPNQILMISANVEIADFTKLVVEKAYQKGAKEVIVNYVDGRISRLHYLYQSEETLAHIAKWKIDSKLDYLKEGAAILHLASEIPNILQDVPSNKLNTYFKAAGMASKEITNYTTSDKTQWCIVGVPNKAWAKQVFPDAKTDEEAMTKLWKAILKTVHIEGQNDAKKAWQEHDQKLKKYKEILNSYQFDHLVFSNDLGTNLTVGLADHHLWDGGSGVSEQGISFFPNMPTEEVFTMPHKYRVNGRVVASKPLDYHGTLVEDFYFEFKDGKVIHYDASSGKKALDEIIGLDEGSSYLGEVALVPYHSPISNSNLLFYNTLFDENAACHLALGQAYPTTIQNSQTLEEKTMKEYGMNTSLTHVDFMFGTKDLLITGYTKDEQEIIIFKNGDYAI